MKVEMWGGPYDGQEYQVKDGVATICIYQPSLLIAREQPQPEPPRTRGDMSITQPPRHNPPDYMPQDYRVLPIVRGADGKHYALWNRRM